MKKLFWLTLAIAILASFFASTNPDGLDFIARKLGFAGKGIERGAPMANYSLKFLPAGAASTAIAAIAGVLIVLSLFWAVAYVLRRGKQ